MEKLLIVDDEEIELDGMAELIDWQKFGYELVGTAINGKRGTAARLQYTAAGDKVCNPNAQSIWVEVDGRHYEIPAGKTVALV